MTSPSEKPLVPSGTSFIIAPGWTPRREPSTSLAPFEASAQRPGEEMMCAVNAALDAEAASPSEGERIGRRLLLAMVGFIFFGPGLLLMLGLVGIHVSAELAVATLAAIGFGAVFAAFHEPEDPDRAARRRARREPEAGGKAIGCCPGPRPLRCSKPHE